MLKLSNILLFEDIQYGAVTLVGRVTGYHYTDMADTDEVLLDPVVAFQKRKSYTMDDYKLSSVPRLWFYLDLKKIERKIAVSSKTLYYTKFKGETILDVNRAIQLYRQDSVKMKFEYPEAYSSVDYFCSKSRDFQQLMQDSVDNGYGGIYYDNGVPMINYFYPIKAKKMEKDDSYI